MLCYIRREYTYLDILHVFYTYPKLVQDTFGIHIRYIKIQQYLARFLGVTLDTYIKIHLKIHQDTCILDSSSRYNLQVQILIIIRDNSYCRSVKVIEKVSLDKVAKTSSAAKRP